MAVSATRASEPAPGTVARALLPEGEPAWTPLRYFNLYRATLAGLMVALVFWGVAPRPIGHYDIGLFRATAIGYLAFAIGAGLAARGRWLPFNLQVSLAVLADISAITLLMHASGGVRSGFGTLLVVAVAGGSILIRRQLAILFAALGTLAVLAQQIYSTLTDPFESANYPHAGMLGASLFAAAILAHFSASRVRASEALAERREIDLANLAELNEHIIQRMQSGIVALDGRGTVRLTNQSARALLGLGADPLLGEPLAALSPALATLLGQWQADGGRWSSRLFQAREDASKVLASFAAIGPQARQGVLVFLEDASAMQQRAQQLKLAALGRLAGGIAHEIRNPLGAVSHAGQLLAESPALGPADRRLIEIIRNNSARMNAIVENVLELARGSPAEPRRIRLLPWLERLAAELVEDGVIGRQALDIEVEPAGLEVRFDPGQLRQVLRNLCENGARHAGNPPRLALRAGLEATSGRPWLEVTDNGSGVGEEARERLFEPFFTTRPGGTGLGLYLSRELCEGNRASLSHVDRAGAGACFRIAFAHPGRSSGEATS